MRQTILSTVGALLFSSGLLAADPQLLGLVMPDAQVMAGINVTTAKTSPFGQYLLTQLAAQGGNHFDQLAALTGFDPRRDLVEVLAATPGNGQAKKSALVLAKGTFNVSQLTDALQKDGHGGQVTNYNGAVLLTGSNGKDPGAVAFLGASIAIAGDIDSVKAAVDRFGHSSAIGTDLAAKVAALSAAEDAWSVSMEPISAFAPKADATAAPGPGAQAAQILKSIQSANGGVKFGSLIVVTAQAVASDAKSASALADVVRLVAGLVTMNGQKNPQVGQILQSLQVSTDGATINLSLSLSETDAEQFLKLAPHAAQANVRRGN